jgi:transposase-like protein
MVVRIAGKHMYLWHAVDHEGEVLESWSSVVETGLRPSS